VSSTPGSTGKGRPGRAAGSGSSPSNTPGGGSDNGGKPSSAATSKVSSVTEPGESNAATSAAADGDSGDATPRWRPLPRPRPEA
jgi:hypothetical protein